MKKFLCPLRLFFLILLCVLLCGCAKKIVLSETEIKSTDQSISAVVTPEDLEFLNDLDNIADYNVSEFCDPAVPHKDLSLRDEGIRCEVFSKQQKIGVASGTDCAFSRIHQQTLRDVFREERERLFERITFGHELAERF